MCGACPPVHPFCLHDRLVFRQLPYSFGCSPNFKNCLVLTISRKKPGDRAIGIRADLSRRLVREAAGLPQNRSQRAPRNSNCLDASTRGSSVVEWQDMHPLKARKIFKTCFGFGSFPTFPHNRAWPRTASGLAGVLKVDAKSAPSNRNFCNPA